MTGPGPLILWAYLWWGIQKGRVVIIVLTVIALMLVTVVTVWDASRRGSEWKKMCMLDVQKRTGCVLLYEMECEGH